MKLKHNPIDTVNTNIDIVHPAPEHSHKTNQKVTAPQEHSHKAKQDDSIWQQYAKQ